MNFFFFFVTRIHKNVRPKRPMTHIKSNIKKNGKVKVSKMLILLKELCLNPHT